MPEQCETCPPNCLVRTAGNVTLDSENVNKTKNLFTSESLDNKVASEVDFTGIGEIDKVSFRIDEILEQTNDLDRFHDQPDDSKSIERRKLNGTFAARCSLNNSDNSLADSSDSNECSFALSDFSDKSSDKPSDLLSTLSFSISTPLSTIPSSDSSHSNVCSFSSNDPAFSMSSTANSVIKANPIITINDEHSDQKAVRATASAENDEISSKRGEVIQIKNVTVKLDEIKTASHSSWLLRLFESKLFNASLAIVYLYKSKEPGVITYLGNRMFQFDKYEVDFFLPQLVTLYINNPNICDAIRPYFLSRCKESHQFSLHLLWLLNSFCFEAKNCHPLIKKKCAGIKLKQSILSEELWCEENKRDQSQSRSPSLNSNAKISELNCTKLLELDSSLNSSSPNSHYLAVKKTHQRSYSETTNVIKANQSDQLGQLHPGHSSNQSLNQLPQHRSALSQPAHRIGDLSSGQAFCNQCICLTQFQSICNELKGEKFKCTCGAPRLLPENSFVSCLISIGKGLQSLTSCKELRMQRLIAELQLLNLNLPAKVYSPVHDHINHLVVRIPPQAAVLLNSKDKAPFLIFIEILKIDGDIHTATLPIKTSNSLRHTRSEENLLNCHQQLRYNRTSNCLLAGNGSTCKLDSLEQYPTLQSAAITISASEIRKRLTTNAIKPASTLDSEDFDGSNAAVLDEKKIKKIREQSPFGHLANWSLLSLIVKTGDDLRQEMMCYQLLQTFKNIWEIEKIPLYIRPYKIIVWSAEGGLIEPILNTISLSQIKMKTQLRLLEYFQVHFGPLTSEGFLTAQRRFVQSCAAYSVVSYLIQLKDRHNGNILLDSSGAIIHIDFQFILSTSPRNLGFENSPFKLTDEIIEVMGGVDSDMFKYFKILILQGLIAARKHHEKLISLVEILQSNTQLPCFRYGPSVIKSLTERFHMKLTEEQLQQHIEQMVENSLNSITTRLYDSFQYYTNNIL